MKWRPDSPELADPIRRRARQQAFCDAVAQLPRVEQHPTVCAPQMRVVPHRQLSRDLIFLAIGASLAWVALR